MDVFADWNERFPRGEGIDHQVGPLTSDSVFLFQAVTAPRPAPAHWGSWSWYENALQLRAHLLYVVLPDMAATWMSEGSMGLHTMRQPLAATVADADEAWAEDKHFFDGLAHDLETASGATNTQLAVELQRIAGRFTDRFGSTSTWDMRLQVWCSAVDAGAFLFERHPELITNDDGEELTRQQWLDVCERAATDPWASGVVEGVFVDAFEL